MDPILTGLNAAQHAAVSSPASILQVLAPPGSGKTKVLTSRVAYLLRYSLYKPWNIICLTFTVKSAKEMKDRMSRLIGDGTEKHIVLGTFHSVCRRYLVTYGHLIGKKRDFGIVDTSDTFAIIKRLCKRLRITIDPKKAQSRISRAKSKGLHWSDLARTLAQKKDVEQQEIVTLFQEYQDYLITSNLLDYDDLLLGCVELLEKHPKCVSNIEAVLVDEFQDTNTVQFELVRLFAASRKSITTVGDPDQSIYGWRSAEIKNLQRMKDCYPQTLVINLEENYRSSGAILLAAQEVIEQDIARPQKSISPTHCPGTVPVLRTLPTAESEANWLVAEIVRVRALTGGMLEYNDFAVLLRSASLSRLLESALSRAGIPYRMVGGQRFFDRAEVKLLLDYLRVISLSENNDALVRIINTPARGVGVKAIETLREEAEDRKQSLWSLVKNMVRGSKLSQTKLSKPAQLQVSDMIAMIMKLQAKVCDSSSPMDPEQLLRHIIGQIKFHDYLKKKYPDDHESRWANVEELLTLASEFSIDSSGNLLQAEMDDMLPQLDDVEQGSRRTGEDALSKFLGTAALTTDVQKDQESGCEGNQDASPVTLSTIHAAKGLEWPVVFIPAVYEGSIPHSRAEDVDEERRLLYVAMTRAQGLLYASCPIKDSQKIDTNLSQFFSTKKVKQHLSSQGPKLDRTTAVELAHILRRRCPTEAQVELMSQNLKSRHDDCWPLKREDYLERDQNTDERGHHRPYFGEAQSKKRKYTAIAGDGHIGGISKHSGDLHRGSTHLGFTTTMEGRGSFSIPSDGVGFRTASTQLQLEKNHKALVCENRSKKSSVDVTFGSKEQNPSQQKYKADGNLLGLWKVRDPSSRRANETSATREKSSSRPEVRSLELAPASATGGKSATLKDLQSKDLHPKHKRPMPLEEKENQYILLSSSPTRQEPGKNESQILKMAAKKPSAAYSPTFMVHDPGVGPYPKIRKSLGVRRSMAGWPPQRKSGF